MKFFRIMMAVNMVLAKLAEAAADGKITIAEMSEIVGIIATAAGFEGIVIEDEYYSEPIRDMDESEKQRLAASAVSLGVSIPGQKAR